MSLDQYFGILFQQIWTRMVYMTLLTSQGFFSLDETSRKKKPWERGQAKDEIMLCNMYHRWRPDPLCRPMQKVFFLQHQWMPFLIATLSILFYLPYIAFKFVNSDLICLQNDISDNYPDVEMITKRYFHPLVKLSRMNTLRIVFHVLVKSSYIVVNLLAFCGLDNLLNGKFVSYGRKWDKWSRLENTETFDYKGKPNSPRPGNLILPSFGLCDVYESAKDIRTIHATKYKLVCELSQNVLYQYCLILVWFAIVFGIVISIVGLILLLGKYVVAYLQFRKSGSRKLINAFSFRQLEYLCFIRKMNILAFIEVMEIIESDYLPSGSMKDDNSRYGRHQDNIPLNPNVQQRNQFDEMEHAYQL